MSNLKLKLTTAVATAALLATTFAPAAFADTIVRYRNTGAGSTNKTKIHKENKVKVEQYNATAVVNLVGVLQNTGGNSATDNTGDGDTNVNSGNANGTINNTTVTGGNLANVASCGCPNGDTRVIFRDTGAGSFNKVVIEETNKTKVTQENETLVVNGVLVGQNTGLNSASGNTGDGNVTVDSGNATANVSNYTATGGNVLNP